MMTDLPALFIEKPLVIAVPKGRILKELRPLMTHLGLMPEAAFFDEDDRKLRFATNHPLIELIRVRSFDVASFVAFGAAHLGICGSDVLSEFDYPDIYAPVDLGIGRCRISLACRKEEVGMTDYGRLSHIRVATKYPNITRRHFAQMGIQAECIKLNGAIELGPIFGLASHIVDLVSTGSTLKANGLAEEATLEPVSSRLIVNRTAFKTRAREMHGIVAHARQALEVTAP